MAHFRPRIRPTPTAGESDGELRLAGNGGAVDELAAGGIEAGPDAAAPADFDQALAAAEQQQDLLTAQETLRKDQIAINAVLALDPAELWRVVDEYDISMCGFIPTTTMLIAAKKLGASNARLIKHATSGDINGDYSHVVGYASVLIS